MRSFFSTILNWLVQLEIAELFISADKRIPGQWHLYEYYTEPDDELFHINEGLLKQNNHFLKVEFTDVGKLIVDSNIQLPVFNGDSDFGWNRQRNFITIFDAESPSDSHEFQFAFQKDILKLLKKDRAGKIVFFGFFKKPEQIKK